MKKYLNNLNTKTKTRIASTREAGFTLPEVLISVVISAFMMSGFIFMSDVILTTYKNASKTLTQIDSDNAIDTLIDYDLARLNLTTITRNSVFFEGNIDNECWQAEYYVTANQNLKTEFIREQKLYSLPCEDLTPEAEAHHSTQQKVHLGEADNIYISIELLNAVGSKLGLTEKETSLLEAAPLAQQGSSYEDDERVIELVNDTTPEWLNITVAGYNYSMVINRQL